MFSNHENVPWSNGRILYDNMTPIELQRTIVGPDSSMRDLLQQVVGVYSPGVKRLPLMHPEASHYGENSSPDPNGETKHMFKSSRPYNNGTEDEKIVEDELIMSDNGTYPFSSRFSNTVLMTFASSKHEDMVLNWICWVKQLGVKFLVFANDEALYDTVTALGYTAYLTPEPQVRVCVWGGYGSLPPLP